MNPEKPLKEHAPAIAAILYEEVDSEQLTHPSGELLCAASANRFVRKFPVWSGLETVSVLASPT